MSDETNEPIVGTLELLRRIEQAGPEVVSPREARMLLRYVTHAGGRIVEWRTRALDAERRLEGAAKEHARALATAIERQAEAEDATHRMAGRLRKERLDELWQIFDDLVASRRSDSLDEYVSIMARIERLAEVRR